MQISRDQEDMKQQQQFRGTWISYAKIINDNAFKVLMCPCKFYIR